MSVFNTQLTINSSGIHIYRDSLKKKRLNLRMNLPKKSDTFFNHVLDIHVISIMKTTTV